MAIHLNKNSRRQTDKRGVYEKALKDMNENKRTLVGGLVNGWREEKFCFTDLYAYMLL